MKSLLVVVRRTLMRLLEGVSGVFATIDAVRVARREAHGIGIDFKTLSRRQSRVVKSIIYPS
jgi:hypothetical protein